MATPPAPGPAPMTFSENERVLCFHGPLLYEAKVCLHYFIVGLLTNLSWVGPEM